MWNKAEETIHNPNATEEQKAGASAAKATLEREAAKFKGNIRPRC